MRRREFITLLGGAAFAVPRTAIAQQPGRMRRIGVLINLSESDQEGVRRLAAFRQGLQGLGWVDGRNLQIDYRFAAADPAQLWHFARELVGLRPEVILGNSTPVAIALLRATRTIPIVFVAVSEPIESGLVETLARPGGNMTGFANLEPSIGGKLVELLKEAVPAVARVAILFNPETTGGSRAFVRSAEAAAASLGVEVTLSPVQDDAAIEDAVTALARRPGDGGLVAWADSFLHVHRELIIAQAARHRLPAIYASRAYTPSGGLMAYYVDVADLFRRAASYADRILKGAKPSELAVQQPTKFELSVNLKTAKALGLTIPSSILARADEVIE